MNPCLLVFIVCFRDEEDFLALGACNSGTFSLEDCHFGQDRLPRHYFRLGGIFCRLLQTCLKWFVSLRFIKIKAGATLKYFPLHWVTNCYLVTSVNHVPSFTQILPIFFSFILLWNFPPRTLLSWIMIPVASQSFPVVSCFCSTIHCKSSLCPTMPERGWKQTKNTCRICFPTGWSHYGEPHHWQQLW
jgi:hypothetical protein